MPAFRSLSASQRGKVSGTVALVTPSFSNGSQSHLAAHLGVRQAVRDQVVGAVFLARVQLEQAELLQARDLHGADRDVLGATPLDVEERIGNPQRHLVPQLGRPEGVAVHQDVGHAADSN